MSVQIEDILRGFEDWQEAKKELLYCYREAERSADYYCQRLAEKEMEARRSFENAFTDFIDQRIKAVTGGRHVTDL